MLLPFLSHPAPVLPGRTVRASSGQRLNVLLPSGERDRFVVVVTDPGTAPTQTLEWYDLQGRLLAKARLPSGELPCGWTLRDGSVPVVGPRGLSAFNVAGVRAWAPIPLPKGTDTAVASTSDGRTIALLGERRLVLAIVEGGRLVRSILLPYVGNVAFGEDGRLMLVGDARSEGAFRLVRLSDLRTLSRFRVPVDGDVVRRISFGGSSDRVVVSAESRFWAYGLTTPRSPKPSITGSFPGWFEDWTAADRLAATTPSRTGVEVLDAATGRVRFAFHGAEPLFFDARLLKGGRLVYVHDFSKVQLLRLDPVRTPGR